MFLATGEKVEVLATFDGGVVVKKLFEESEYPEFDEVDPIIVPKVYEAAPVAAFDEQVKYRLKRLANVDDELSAKQKQLDGIRAELKQAEVDRKAITSRIAADAAIRRVMDVIDNKIEWFVTSQYGLVEVKNKDVALKQSDKWERDWKLVTVYGKTNGNLSYGINYYSDGSGSQECCWPCVTHTEACEIAKRVIEEGFAKETWLESLAKSADTLGIPVPQSIRDKIRDYARKNIETEIARHENDLKKLKESLARWT